MTTFDSYMWGNVLLVLGSIVWAFYGIAQKQLLLNLPSASVLLCLYLSAATLFAPMAHPERLLTLSGSHLAALIFCAFNTLIAYGAFAAALEHWEASRVSVVLTLAPIVTLAASTILPNFIPQLLSPSPLSLLGWIGAIAVVVGSMATSLGSKPKKSKITE